MDSETDRLSALLDNSLSSRILSKISYRDVVRCSLLSKRWRFLWKEMPILVFRWQDFEKQKDDEICTIICNALFHHDVLHSFLLKIALDDPKTADLNNWIRLAAEKQVRSIELNISYRDPKTGKRIDNSSMVDLGDSVFSCENLTSLTLQYINLPKVPTDFGIFEFLKTFNFIKNLSVDDTTLEEFIGVCPNLENLEIRSCMGLKNLYIDAPTLMYLSLGNLSPEISLQMDCPLLTEVNLMDCGKYQGIRLLQGISSKESVTVISLQNYSRGKAVNLELPSITVLNGFPELEELIIHGQCFQEMISDEIPVPELTLPKLEMVDAHIGPDNGVQTVTFLGLLLRSSPVNVTRVFLWERCPTIMRKKLQNLKKEFSKSRVSIATRGWSMEWKEHCPLCSRYRH
ncbi:hypothetical protein SUGI_0954050 [Cryptomeria japonica]|uniref:F-box/LRR-repeat protein At3g26922 n=1 Tax=Cryptomeria japonica TaxID=3369 RepID=UPI002414B4B4|nr:F-box/LRR-repeat protein At3g26922 [Cryptomeria japonica]GLJ45322.1 hypothetical protein SUGI_0954050 [Cryptomeria japonica]